MRFMRQPVTLNRGPVVIGTRDVITANDVINNRPIEFNSTRNMDQFFNCDNKTSNFDPQNVAKGTEDKSKKSRGKNTSKSKTTWQELSPKKERKSLLSGESSGSGSSSTASSPTKSWKSLEKGTNQNQMLTWRDVSPTKSDRGIVSSSSDSQYSPKREPGRLSSSSDSQSSPRRDHTRQLSSSSDSQYSPRRDKLSSSSSDSQYSPKRRPNRGQRGHIRSPEHACSRHRTGTINQNETYKVHDSPEHGHARFSPPSPSRGFPAAGGMDDAASNDYFYDEDFTVQFDTNLRESSPGVNCSCVDPDLMIGFPHVVTGSYLSFGGGAKGTNILDQNSTELFCPDESELSYSRNSAMDVSTSEREMMCSSDMLDFSDNPLFTPSPTGDLHGAGDLHGTGEQLMTDSLDKVTVKCQFPVLGLTPEQYQGQVQNTMEMSSSRTSSENNFCLNCCPRKDEYHLSFIGSQGSKGSGSDLENSLTSLESGQCRYSQQQGSVCSTDGEECSDSFHFCYSGTGPHGKGKVIGSRGQKFHALGGIQETSMEHSVSSEDSVSPKLTPTSKQDLKLFSSGTLPRHLGSRGCQVTSPKKRFQPVAAGHSPLRSTLPLSGRQRSKKVTSWRQVKSLRRLGKLESVLDPSRSSSMPDLCLHQTWQSLSSQDIQRLAESFHNKRHSAYLLDLYQRAKDQSNPVSPETMANIEQILFQHPIGQTHHHPADPPMAHHNNNCSEITREDSYSDHTLTNSHAQFLSAGVNATTHSSPGPASTPQPHPLQYSTRKRILEWLEKEKFDATNKSKGSQTEVTKCTKETVVSPTTITLWCGTKNFSSQFPPSMKDCAIQTTVTEDVKPKKPSMHDSAQQTTPISEKNSVLSMLPESFNELEEILPKFEPPDGKKSKGFMPRSKSADSARRKTSLTVGICEKNTFYSHKSLPDLSFLSATVFTANSDISLFDPLPLDTPLPVFSESEEYAKTQEYIRNKAAYHSHYGRHEAPSGANYKRSRSAPPRHPINANLSRNCAESGSSSSGFSTSSTSSGIDPGYSEPRSSQTGSPSNDIERLLFYPPHIEISSSSKSPCHVCKSEDGLDIGQISTGPPPQLLTNQLEGTNKALVRPTAEKPDDKKIHRYTNEVHPGMMDVRHRPKQPVKPVVASTVTTNSSHLEHLYVLQEEQTPVSSPERISPTPYSSRFDHTLQCCHDNCTCYISMENERLAEWRRDQLILRRKLDYQIQLSSESGSSSSSSLIPNIDKKPLKSCLRKKQVLRSRSMSEPYLIQQIEGRRLQGQKVNRHSYACEEIYLLQDETGEYFLCENKDETEEEEVEDGDEDEDEKETSDPVMFYLEDDSVGNSQTVRRRQKKPVEEKKESCDDSSDKELSGKRKSVSFASEVSFHAISPQDSPKRRNTNSDTDDSEDTEAKQETVHCTPKDTEAKQETVNCTPKDTEAKQETVHCTPKDTEAKQETVHCTPKESQKEQPAASTAAPGLPESTPKPVPAQTLVSSLASSADSDSAPPAEFLLSPPQPEPQLSPFSHALALGPETARRRVMLHEVSQAAESLVRHFAKAMNPFDKLRLGSTADSPEVGDLVLSTLCSVLTRVVSDGMKPYLAGVQVFGRVQVTVWKVTEASAEQGPYTRAVHELVQQLKANGGLTTNSMKFEAFIFSLLNLRLLDYWMGYLRYSDTITEKYYNPDGVIVLGRTAHQVEYDEMLTSLQALAVLPFQLGLDFLTEKYAKTKSASPSHSPSKGLPLGSPTDDKQAPAKPPRRTPTGITSKAWDWLKGGATEPPAEQVLAESNGMISSFTGMLGKWTGWDTSKGDGLQAPPTNCQSQQPANQNQPTQNVVKVENDNPELTVTPQKLTGRCPVAEEEEFQDCEIETEPSDTAKGDKSSSPLKVQIDKTEPVSESVAKELSPSHQISTTEKKTTHEMKVFPEKLDPDKEEESSLNIEKTMIESVTGITQKLLGMGNQREKPAYRKGVTDYDFNKEQRENTSAEKKLENDTSETLADSSKPPAEKSSEVTAEPGTDDKAAPVTGGEKQAKPEGGKLQTSAERKSMIPTATSRPKNLGMAKGKTEAKPTGGKNKSGLIKLFDKLLLPKENNAPPKAASASQIPKIKTRWSWGAGAQNQAPVDTKTGVGARPKSVCVMKTEPSPKQTSTAPAKKRPNTTTTKEDPKNLNASPVTRVGRDQNGGLGKDQAELNATQSKGDAVKDADKSVQNAINAGQDQLLTIQLDKTTGEASLQQTFHVDDNGEAKLRQRYQLDQTGKARDQNLTVQWDRCSPVKLQQTVHLDQGQAKLHQTMEVDQDTEGAAQVKTGQGAAPVKAGQEAAPVKAGQEAAPVKAGQEEASNKAEGKDGNVENAGKTGEDLEGDKGKKGKGGDKKAVAAGRAAWKAVERGPTLFLPTNCKFLDNIEKRNNDPESPKRKASPNRRSTPSSTNSSPANSPKSPRSNKTKRRWSLHGNTFKKEPADLDILNSNSNSPDNNILKSAPTTPSKGKTVKTDPSNSSADKSDQSKPSRSDKSKNLTKKLANGKAASGEKEKKKLANQKSNKEEKASNEKKSSDEKEEGEFRFLKPVYRYIQTLKAYEATDPSYLSYGEGEYFEVLAQIDAIRLFCVQGKKEGLIQVEAVKSVTDKDEFHVLHDNFYR
ncbi:uncharacterized protein LOC110451029 isoform X2 [Mizuhopecten yessoensis]|uniref:uncharacterized protein LOC110451029 isoform X2 n=1 Tax=Mizuhopecten yessoensis TaxID=6573 RepID=UPI000B45BE08|nr:uncharacterized protein LOC110451029 isoform X2 [Mizuhopecten yessoensis]